VGDNNLVFWEPALAACMALGSMLPGKKQTQLLEIYSGLAQSYEKKGNLIAANFLRALALEPPIEPKKKFRPYIVHSK
jgi:hypothetical protein